MTIVDFHTHVLPGIDDGSQNIETSLGQLKMLKDQGVDIVVATPHFYAHKVSASKFLSKREAAYEQLLNAMNQQNLPELKMGSEVYYFDGISKADILSELCIQGTNIMLLEMPFCQWTKDIYQDVKDIVLKRNIRLVLAHVERYYEFQKDKTWWEKVLALKLICQINSGSFVPGGLFRKKTSKFCIEMLKNRGVVLLGSDTHNLKDRAPNIEAGRAAIEKGAGAEYLDKIDQLAQEMLSTQGEL